MELDRYKKIKRNVEISGHNIVPFLASICDYFESNGIEISPLPKVNISATEEYMTDPFGKTAFYDPLENSITLFVAGRHIKDILRSFAHELIHHNQFLTGMFDERHLSGLDDPRYAEKDEHLKKMEEDAYLRGNMMFRSWEDSIK
jgi:hypothetical protein